MPADQLGAMSQHGQRGDGAKASGLKVYGGPVVYLAVDYRVDQVQDLGGEFRHGLIRPNITLRPVVAAPEVRGSLSQVLRSLTSSHNFSTPDSGNTGNYNTGPQVGHGVTVRPF